jgi:hypothetical protein
MVFTEYIGSSHSYGPKPFFLSYEAQAGEISGVSSRHPLPMLTRADIFAQNEADAKHFQHPLSAKAGLSAYLNTESPERCICPTGRSRS